MPRYSVLGLILCVMAAVGAIAGFVLIEQGASKYLLIRSLAQTEKVTIGLTDEQIKNGEFVDSLGKMQAAGDIIRSHRQQIAATYGELTASSGGKYDPTNAKDLTYAQAINLENYLYLGALSFGVTYLMVGVGAFMLLTALGMAIVGFALRRMSKE
jgi:hypothetical protein